MTATPRRGALEFRALGPLELCVAGRTVSVGPVKQRTVLAALLLEPGRVVPPETLIHRVWDGSPPAEVRNVMYTYVTRLRRVLEDAAEESGEPVELVRKGGGYLLGVDPDRVDLHRFTRLVGQARGAACDGDRARLLEHAIGLWRGVPLAGLSGSWVVRVRDRLERQRLDALAQRADVELRLGRPEGVIAELREALAERPLSEPLLGRLLRALYAAGQAAEALGTYATARERIVDEVGAEPSAQLRRLHEGILRETLPTSRSAAAADPGDTGGAGHRPAAVSQAVPVAAPPNMLPADVVDFTGRDAEVGLLCRALAPGQRTATPVAAVVGAGGLGKTTLAVHVAHRLRGQFPDGQLFVDLRGSYPDRVEPAKAAERLLRALGVTSTPPASLAEQAEMYRTLLADRRILVVLDDAGDEAQLEPLLPGTVSCAVLVTGRPALAGLSCLRSPAEPLRPAEAGQLLARIAGTDRVAAEPVATAELSRLCDHVPLAIRIAGGRLVGRPHWSIAEMVSRLEAEGGRLDELELGGLSVRGSLQRSYAQLDQQARRLFRRLGLLAAGDVAGGVAALLLGQPDPVATETLERLIDAQLVQVTSGPGGHRVYRLPGLVRAYARDRASTENEPAPEPLTTVAGTVFAPPRDGLGRIPHRHPRTAWSA